MKIHRVILVLGSFLFLFSTAGADMKEKCISAGGVSPGLTQPDKSHHDGVLGPGPIGCLCGKTPFIPRPGDTCVEGKIHTAYQNICDHAGGSFTSAKSKGPECLCGTQSISAGQCCYNGVISKCDGNKTPAR